MAIQTVRVKRGSGRFKIGRFVPARTRTRQLVPIIRTPRLPISVIGDRLTPTYEPVHPVPALAIIPAQDHSPEARARRARRKLAQRYAKATRAAQGKARLCRADEYRLLRKAYAMVRRWREDEIVEEIERELRAQAEVAISRGSNLFLVFLRSALPRLDVKRASKLAGALEIASQQDVGSGRLCAYLRNVGGIE